MEHFLIDLSAILPEITLILGAMVLLLYGAYFSSEKPRWVISLSLALLAVIAYQLYCMVGRETTAFYGMIKISAYTLFAKYLILIAGAAVIYMLYPLTRRDDYIRFEMPILILLSMGGMMFLVSSRSLLSLYMSLEIMSLSLYVLAAIHRDNAKSTEAGMKYFILGALSSGIFLYGASIVYGFTGAINFDEIMTFYTSFSPEGDTATIPIGFLIGLIFMIVALCFKVSAVPFHMWTPDVYQGAPTIVTAFFASAPKVAALVLFAKLLLEPFVELVDQWQQVIVFASIASMFVGSFGAIVQKNFKRLLAYSSIGHVGFALIGIAAADDLGIRGFLAYLGIYLTMTLAAFACLLMMRRDGKYKEGIYDDMAGLSKTNPYLAFALAVIMLSMAGIPPLAGFFAKFYVLLPAIEKGMYGLAISGVIASVIAAYYYLIVIKTMYFEEGGKKLDSDYGWALRVVAVGGTAFNLLYVLIPAPLLSAAAVAAKVLFK